MDKEREQSSGPSPRTRPSVKGKPQARGSARPRTAASSESRSSAGSRASAGSPESRESARSRAEASARTSGASDSSRTSGASDRSSTSRASDSPRASRASRGDAKSASTTRRRVQTRQSGGATAAASPLAGKEKIVIACIAAIVLVALIAGLALGLSGNKGEEAAEEPSGEATGSQFTRAAGPYSISFATTGDLIFWREVADYIDKNGGASAMANIADHLAQADVTISNLESPLSKDESEPIEDKDVYIIGRPSAIESIKNSDITFVSLANNHIMDYGAPALKDTLDALDDADVLHAGAGMTEDEAGKLAEITVNGVSIAFLSWTDIVPDNFLAYKEEPGVVSARMSMTDACKRVREAKETHDIVIVAMHWGVEYEDYITDYLQSDPAHQLVDAGADVIIGNHPHVIEGIEFYNGALIAYAHGNCVFWQKYDHTHESFIMNFDMTENGVQNVVVTPLYLDDKYGIPSISTGKQAQTTLSRLEEISEGMNTSFEIRDDKAYVTPIETQTTAQSQ